MCLKNVRTVYTIDSNNKDINNKDITWFHRIGSTLKLAKECNEALFRLLLLTDHQSDVTFRAFSEERLEEDLKLETDQSIT